MKHTKRLLAILIAALILAVSAAPALAAYTPVKLSDNAALSNPVIKHTTSLVNSTVLPYDITYTLTVNSAAKTWDVTTTTTTSGEETKTYALNNAASTQVSGTPQIKSKNKEASDADNVLRVKAGTYPSKSIETEFEIDFSGVEFKEPGTYVWEVAKQSQVSGGTETVTNRDATTYIFATVINDADNDGKLKVSAVNYARNSALSQKENLTDSFPATVYDLTISKEVLGSHGSREQYFSFTVSISTPANAAGHEYSISGTYDSNVPATANNAAVSGQPDTVTTTAAAGTNIATGEVTIWLKHGQNFKIEGLPTGSSYEVVEGNNAGYAVDAEVTSTEQIKTWNKDTVSSDFKVKDTSITANTAIEYENTKISDVPTGITLQMAAPLFGIVLAGLLMAVVLFSKRRENH